MKLLINGKKEDVGFWSFAIFNFVTSIAITCLIWLGFLILLFFFSILG
jgi:hypothetical protein